MRRYQKVPLAVLSEMHLYDALFGHKASGRAPCDNIVTMRRWLTITAVDPAKDNLGIEVVASNERFEGSAWIYAGIEELSEFAAKMNGFPRSCDDCRTHEFGPRGPAFAGGFVSITVRCLDHASHLAIDVLLKDDTVRYSPPPAAFSFQTEPGVLNHFVENLRNIDRDRFRSPTLAAA